MRIIDRMLCLKNDTTDCERKKVRYWLICLDLGDSSTFKGENLVSYDTFRTWVLNKPAEETAKYINGAILYDFEKEDFILASTHDFDEETGIFNNEDEIDFELCNSSEAEEDARCTLRGKLPFIGNSTTPVSASEQIYTLVSTLYKDQYLYIKTKGVYFRINISDLPSIPYHGLTITCRDGFAMEYEARITECLEDTLKLDIDGIKAEIGTNFSNQPINVETGIFVDIDVYV